MCEHCGDKRVWRDEGELDEEEWFTVPCQWSDDEESSCDEDVRYVVYTRDVELHLCTACVDWENHDLDSGLGDFLRRASLQKSVDYLPISPGTKAIECETPKKRDGQIVQCGIQTTYGLITILA